MEAGSRKRCHLCVVSLAALLVLLVWIHGEIVTVKFVGTARNYFSYLYEEEGYAHVKQKLRSRFNESTANLTAGARNATKALNKGTPAHFIDETPEIAFNPDTQLLNMTTGDAAIIVFLSGEMGNHLSILAKALSVKLLAQEHHNISANLVFRHQSHPKWIRAREALQNCFPKLRAFNFSAANTDAFDDFAREQDRLLVQGNWDPSMLKLDSDQDSETSIDSSLAYWKSILESPSSRTVKVDAGVKFPFLSVASWCPLIMLDHYLDEIRHFFEFDRSSCCDILPDADESVFHLRNFLVEMPRKGKQMGYEELSPNKTALELFGHLNRNEKIAITTRFGGDDVAPYVSALKEQGLQVRVIQNQTGTQDFCFLMSAKKELVGTYLSTFVDWASYFGDAKRVNLYRVISPSTSAITYPSFNWRHSNLKGRVYSEAYKSEEQDALEANAEEQGRMLRYNELADIFNTFDLIAL